MLKVCLLNKRYLNISSEKLIPSTRQLRPKKIYIKDATEGVVLAQRKRSASAVLARSRSKKTTVAIVDAIELLEANGLTELVS